MTLSQSELMFQAKDLADRLASAGTPVKPNTFRSLVAGFMGEPEPEPAVLRRTLGLLKEGRGGHLKRSGSFPDQALAAVSVLEPLLKTTDLEPRQLKTLFGWAARLLWVRTGRGQRASASSSAGGRRLPATPPKTGLVESEEYAKSPASKMSVVKGGAQNDLEELMARLKRKERGV